MQKPVPVALPDGRKVDCLLFSSKNEKGFSWDAFALTSSGTWFRLRGGQILGDQANEVEVLIKATIASELDLMPEQTYSDYFGSH